MGQAFQAAIVSNLRDNDLQLKQSFYYWAAFIPHGFASVKLDAALLERIHSYIKSEGLLPGDGQHVPDGMHRKRNAASAPVCPNWLKGLGV